MKARESKGKPTKTGKASESRESKPKNFPRSPKHSKDARQKEKTPKKRPRNPRPSKILPKLTPNPAPTKPSQKLSKILVFFLSIFGPNKHSKENASEHAEKRSKRKEGRTTEHKEKAR